MIRKNEYEEKYRETILQKYSDVVSVDSAKARSLIKKLNYRRDQYLLECIAQTYFDESLFNKNGSRRTYFEGRKLRLAEKYIIEAYNINEDCIDVLWTLGRVRKAYSQIDLAIYCFKRIIELGRKKIIKNKYDTFADHTHVQTKVNDSKFELYRVYYDKGDIVLSKRYLSMYKRGLEKGMETIYKPLDKFLIRKTVR